MVVRRVTPRDEPTVRSTRWLTRPRKVQLAWAAALLLAALLPLGPTPRGALVAGSVLLALEAVVAAARRRRWWNAAGPCRVLTPGEAALLAVAGAAAALFGLIAALSVARGWGFAAALAAAALLLLATSALELWSVVQLLSRRLLWLLPPESDAPPPRLDPAQATVHVRSEQDIVDAVRRAAAEGLRVRPVGSRCSSACYRAPGAGDAGFLLLDLSTYEDVLAFDPERRRIHVQAGILQEKLCRILEVAGLALPATNGSGKLTVGGTLATGSICGARYLLSDSVLSLTVVEADGQVVTVERTRDAELFGAYLCSLGALGVISSIELELVPSFVVRGAVSKISFDELLARSEPATLRSADYMISDWYPGAGQVLSRRFHRQPPEVGLGERRPQASMTPSESAASGRWLAEAAASSGAWLPLEDERRAASASSGSRPLVG